MEPLFRLFVPRLKRCEVELWRDSGRELSTASAVSGDDKRALLLGFGAIHEGENLYLPFRYEAHLPKEARSAIARILGKLALYDGALAEHSLSTGRLGGRIARIMELSVEDEIDAAVVGTLHEVGLLDIGTPRPRVVAGLSNFGFEKFQAAAARSGIALLASDRALSRYADLVGETYADVVSSAAARIAVVADLYDALTRDLLGLGPVSREQAIYALEGMRSSRFHWSVIAALPAAVRRGDV
jgi:5'-deoxynucleotidase YfbR-like HD superfamily hydrolase